ncbi:hypothetical protein [Glutamicibacter sp.]|uniref:hypothetical protein n=1 Tax=Glutamicibacter sp. TaxID=1931995 RepID=UPI002B4810B5|nr:hypothetical protein [Glutamicibacter sp.]HJX79391.1 hypothetical protein [Glutamicibacter sp.]
MFKNEAVAKDSLLITGPLSTKSDVADVVLNWVHWFDFGRLHSTLGYCTPVEFEELYYDEMSGSLPDDAASKLAASFPGRFWLCTSNERFGIIVDVMVAAARECVALKRARSNLARKKRAGR